MKIGIIGGGAAGFFAAIAAKENYPEATVVILEKSRKLLAKVKISGGGRCNVTNGCTSIPELCKAYPRGGRQLKKPFHVFNTKHTMAWFEARGVPLVIQEDQCVFPVSQDSQSIIDCFLREARRLDLEIRSGMGVKTIKQRGDQLELSFQTDEAAPLLCDKVIVTTGGSPQRSGLDWLEALNHQIEPPVPSLFTFNMPQEAITQLMGVVVDPVLVIIQGTKIKAEGPLLVTHWGMSGPAILKVSAFGARLVHEMGYDFKVQVNWTHEQNNNVVMEVLERIISEHPNKLLANIKPYGLSERLWLFLLDKGDLPPRKKWGSWVKKDCINSLIYSPMMCMPLKVFLNSVMNL